MEEKKVDTTDVLIGWILLSVLTLPMVFLRAAVLLKLWQWFAETRTGITFTVCELAGLWMLFIFIKPASVDTKKDSITEGVIYHTLATSMMCLIAFLCGWVIHSLGR